LNRARCHSGKSWNFQTAGGAGTCFSERRYLLEEMLIKLCGCCEREVIISSWAKGDWIWTEDGGRAFQAMQGDRSARGVGGNN
jgi:hypothetical protein